MRYVLVGMNTHVPCGSLDLCRVVVILGGNKFAVGRWYSVRCEEGNRPLICNIAAEWNTLIRGCEYSFRGCATCSAPSLAVAEPDSSNNQRGAARVFRVAMGTRCLRVEICSVWALEHACRLRKLTGLYEGTRERHDHSTVEELAQEPGLISQNYVHIFSKRAVQSTNHCANHLS